MFESKSEIHLTVYSIRYKRGVGNGLIVCSVPLGYTKLLLETRKLAFAHLNPLRRVKVAGRADPDPLPDNKGLPRGIGYYALYTLIPIQQAAKSTIPRFYDVYLYPSHRHRLTSNELASSGYRVSLLIKRGYA